MSAVGGNHLVLIMDTAARRFPTVKTFMVIRSKPLLLSPYAPCALQSNQQKNDMEQAEGHVHYITNLYY